MWAREGWCRWGAEQWEMKMEMEMETALPRPQYHRLPGSNWQP
jgi:hypothetical protein